MFILSYLIASIFITVFTTTLDTIMLCLCEDRQKHGTKESEFEGAIRSDKPKDDSDQPPEKEANVLSPELEQAE